jgi:orotidine-5'-phosphate decarboxylase
MTQVIVALDVDTLAQEEELLEKLKGSITFYKVGLRLFTAHGHRAVELVQKAGGKVFLDLKFHDIPKTVEDAVRATQKLGVAAVSLHLMGGADMVRAASEVLPSPPLWGGTFPTSRSRSAPAMPNRESLETNRREIHSYPATRPLPDPKVPATPPIP